MKNTGNTRNITRLFWSLLELRKEAALPRKADSSYDLCVAANQVVVDWITAHIMQYDRRFGAFLKTARQKAC